MVVDLAEAMAGEGLGDLLRVGQDSSLRSRSVVGDDDALASMLGGLALLAVAGAPRDLLAFLLTLLIEAALALLVTLAWKVSLHAWVSTIGATALVVLYGPVALLLWPVLAGIGWSRVELEDHTLPQVLVGTLLGTLATAAIFPLLR